MKLKVILALTLATACSAFALNGGRPAATAAVRSAKATTPAFVRPAAGGLRAA
eukprot:CAMPEP_0172553252 /NCGR_PEP_ID=MMETSP1067-20121228/49680_1 /TAXON_ID=265564 ORGANISM="Thalassiosira punctigera, Strain Tpunct2005C2" /NCGR_SAMPLE_ID=MMETSP1067 /ASSEMBLY_ACC=CAM_ASM_000444 /LENGTH=52 /DNA_ID=CAMNT_0013341407 /DNA_START=49 /DNA_END=204 /DNA_ORIENTATION=-